MLLLDCVFARIKFSNFDFWISIFWLIVGEQSQQWYYGLVAFAISLDRDGIKFGLGDDGNLGMEVDAKMIF